MGKGTHQTKKEIKASFLLAFFQVYPLRTLSYR